MIIENENEMIHGSPARSRTIPRRGRNRVSGRVFKGPPPGPPVSAALSQGEGAWDVSQRDYLARLEAGEPGILAPGQGPRIEAETSIDPQAIAEGVCQEASRWLGEAFPSEWSSELAERASVVYAHNARFRSRLRKG